MSRIFWDTNVFIYLFEGLRNPLSARAGEMFARMEQRGDDLVTSTMTLGEVLAGAGSPAHREELQLEMESSARILPFDKTSAGIFADLRSFLVPNRPRPADAIQLAIAASEGVDLFVTADRSLAAHTIVPGIHFIATLDSAPI